MDEQSADAEDGQLPPLSHMPYPVLKRILQYVYGSGGSAPLQYRLVCQSFNYLILRNIRLNLYYMITSGPNKCRLSRDGNSFPTDDLINSSLIDRIFTVDVVKDSQEESDDWDRQDLIGLASELSRPVDVNLNVYSGSLPILPVAEMPLMRLVKIHKDSQVELTVAQLDFMASLQHLTQLFMSRRNVLQLNQRVDLLKISELDVDWEGSKQPNLDLNFSDNYRNLQWLSIVGIVFYRGFDSFNFRGVKLPLLVNCYISIVVASSHTLPSKVDGTKRLIASMRSAMPMLKRLFCTVYCGCAIEDPNDVSQMISAIFQFCPVTYHLNMHITGDTWRHTYIHNLTRFQWKWLFRSLFNSVLDSNVNRVVFRSDLNPDAFQFKKSRSGVQVGMPERNETETCPLGRFVRIYQLRKKRNGQISTLHIVQK